MGIGLTGAAEIARPAIGVRDEWARGWRRVPVRGDYVIRVLVAFASLSVAMIGLGLLLVHVLDGTWLGSLDRDLAWWFADQRSPDVKNAADVGAMLSDTYTIVFGFVVASVTFVVIFRRWHETVFLATALLLEKCVFLVTTYMVGRDRPPVGQLDLAPPTKSYTSGHVGAAVVFYTVCAVVVCLHTRRRAVRTGVVVVAVAAPIIVAVSRMLQGMHYVTDVGAGATLGAASVLAGVHITRRSIKSHRDDRESGARPGLPPSCAPRDSNPEPAD
jgi:membrane-associated phospholipid phosphatase